VNKLEVLIASVICILFGGLVFFATSAELDKPFPRRDASGEIVEFQKGEEIIPRGTSEFNELISSYDSSYH